MESTAMKAEPMPPSRRGKLLFPLVAILGLVFLSYLLGAAVLFFDLPSSHYLRKAFEGAQAWSAYREATSPTRAKEAFPTPGLKIDKPGQTYDGFTLYMTASMTPATSNTEAFLINMRGDVVHRWEIPFSLVWPKPPHLTQHVNDLLVCFFGTHLYANGDLLVVFHGMEGSKGYGLVKLDKNSQVVWKYPAGVHHDVDVAEDGTIYAVKKEPVYELPKGLEFLPIPSWFDYLFSLTPDGKELLKPISILETLRDSPYFPLLSALERPREGTRSEPSPLVNLLETTRRADVLHTNSVKVLKGELAPRFPLFKAGQVLLSMRHLDTIAVMDPQKGSIVWATRGPWRAQHDAHFLDNGHLLLFDNLGSPASSRVLEYDLHTQGFPWCYPSENNAPFLTKERGMSQRLPNGNTLIVTSEGGEIMEVTEGKDVVWSYSCGAFINTGRRYSAAQVSFLKGDQRARP